MRKLPLRTVHNFVNVCQPLLKLTVHKQIYFKRKVYLESVFYLHEIIYVHVPIMLGGLSPNFIRQQNSLTFHFALKLVENDNETVCALFEGVRRKRKKIH
jgi:hypothetical protein